MPTPKHVFLDTHVFEQEFYDFDSLRFRHLKQLVAEGHAHVLMTEITRREVLARIRETTAKAVQAVKRFRKEEREVGILRHLAPKFSEIFAKHDTDELSGELVKQFETFCKEFKIEVLPTSLAEKFLPSICDDYFEMRAPFREGAKRSEFPDAISCAILRKWCSQHKKDLFVVTGDGDWEGMCGKDRLTHIPSLTDFLCKFPDPGLAQDLIVGLRGPSADLLSERIADDFTGLGFVPSGVDGTIENIDDVTVSFDEIVVVEAKDGHAVAELTCEITFTAEVNYEVSGTGIWDSEDEILRFAESDTKDVQDTTRVTVEVAYEYDENDPTCMIELESINIDAYDIEIDCSQLDRW